MVLRLMLTVAILGAVINAQCSWITTDNNGIGRKVDLTNLPRAKVDDSNEILSIEYSPCGNYAYLGAMMVYIDP